MRSDKGRALFSRLHRKRRSLSRRLAACGRLVKGSLVFNRRRCGKRGCQCATGELHESLAFTYKQAGKSVSVHIPTSLETEARKAQNDYRKLKALVEELSSLNLEWLKDQARHRTTRKR